ncbi:prolyl-tRNA synthetase associated domain-containing protein [Rhodovulum sp. DZ06]|uniref:prolyl-tRNA synthetase associated domain-containing protein n=1 Tax=Rhodovulum sp. DZ06 TaxID=3425126 RepID=UPI003D333740
MTDAALTPPTSEADLLALLDRLGVQYTLHRHKPVFTVEESAEIEHSMPGWHTKNLFLKEKKGGFWLICCEAKRQVKVRDVVRAAGGKNPSFGKPEDLWRLMGLRPGSVCPFGLVNDAAREISLILDAEMMRAEIVNFHPLHNEATVALAPADLLRFLEHTGHAPALVEFADLPVQD